MIKKTIIITGGLGFIGSHFVEAVHRNTEWNIIIIDKMSYASMGFERIRSMDLMNSPRVKIFTYDLVQPISKGLAYEIGKVNYIVHFAAGTHVDNSIADPVPFMKNNIVSTINLLEYARTLPDLEKFFYFSTDEVFGPAPDDMEYREWDRHKPTNPYSASKSAAENISLAYHNTYRVPVIIINVMNAFGERQHIEKFIPKVMRCILLDEEIPIHADETCTKIGSRFYIHARNIADAVMFLIDNGEIGDKYNIRGEREMNNLEMAQFIARVMNKPLKYKLVNFHSDRPGHDLRYGLDNSKIASMGWELPITFEKSLEKTIKWTLNHPEWLEDTLQF